MKYIEEGHLGGYIQGGDEATFYPDLWSWLVKKYGVKSVLDVGCGDGVAVDYFRSLGANASGVDGVEQNHLYIYCHDFTKGIRTTISPISYDLAWSCEFVEHVEEEYVENFLAEFENASILLMTHATPGQQGYHHVNCQNAQYWVEKVKEVGFSLNTKLTMKTRQLAGFNKSPWNHYVRSGLAFDKTDSNAYKRLYDFTYS